MVHPWFFPCQKIRGKIKIKYSREIHAKGPLYINIRMYLCIYVCIWFVCIISVYIASIYVCMSVCMYILRMHVWMHENSGNIRVYIVCVIYWCLHMYIQMYTWGQREKERERESKEKHIHTNTHIHKHTHTPLNGFTGFKCRKQQGQG